MASEAEIETKLVRKLLKRRVVGAKKERVETVVRKTGLARHEEGRAKDVLEDLLTDPDSPVQGYGGGGRKNVQLTSVEDAVAFLEERGEDPPFGFGD
jgi:hypothetical protein